jgi:tetratricopeptide (TPR) repeat protein
MRLFLPCLPVLLILAVPLTAQVASLGTDATPLTGLGALTQPRSPAQRAYELGQQAMDRDRLEEAAGQFQLCLRLDRTFVQAHLSLAATYLAMSDDRRAAVHLASYLQARPNHFLLRLHLGEALIRLKRHGEAAPQLERFVAEVQDFPRLADEHLVGCHTRLMEIAEELGDDYGEHLNRGIGLYLLARKRLDMGDDRSRGLAEEMLCKAAAELTLARQCRPGAARPWWYLHGVWTRLAQRQPAVRCLRAAAANAHPGALTPAERRELDLAACTLSREMHRK